MFIYDLIAIVLIGISHVFLYFRLIRYNQLSYIIIVAVSIIFTILLGVVVTVTGYPEFNTIMILLFLLCLGLMKNVLTFMQNLYFTLVSMVSITFAKMVLVELGFKVFMWTPFNLYLWTGSIIHLIVSVVIIVSIMLWRNQIQKLAQYIVR